MLKWTMPRPCSTCKHPNRNAIEAALSEGMSFRNIAAQYQVSASSVFRHKEHTVEFPKAPGVESGASPIVPSSNLENESDIATGQRLTLKQKLFVEHYLIVKNGREAAELAGYTGDDATLRSMAVQNLSLPHIRAEIDRRLRPFILSADEVLNLLSAQASGSVDDLLTADGRLDLEKARRTGSIRNIKKLHFNKDGKLQSLELHDAQSAAQLLGRNHKLFTDKIETNQQPDEQEELKSQVLTEIAQKYNLTEEKARDIVESVFGELEPTPDLASDSVS